MKKFLGLVVFAFAMVVGFTQSAVGADPAVGMGPHQSLKNVLITDPRVNGKTTVILSAAPAVSDVPPAGMVYVWYTIDNLSQLVTNYKLDSGVVPVVTTPVFTTRTVGGNPLSANVTNAMLKSAVLAATLYAGDLTDGASVVMTTRTVGGNALSADVSGAMLKAAVLAETMYSTELTPAGDALFLSAAQKAVVVGNTGTTKASMYEAVADDDTAGSKSIVTGLSTIGYFSVTIIRAGVPIYSDQKLSVSAGSILVEDGGATYAITAGDKIYWMAVGAL